MLSIELSAKKFWDSESEGYIFLVKEGYVSASDIASLDPLKQFMCPHFTEQLKNHLFEGKRGQTFVMGNMHNGALAFYVFVGLGKLEEAWHIELEHMRRAIASATHQLKKYSIKSALLALPDEKPFHISDTELLKQIAIAVHMASYEFTTFKSDKKDKVWDGKIVIAINPQLDKAAYTHSLAQANIIGNSINQARHWADLPANHLTPTVLAAEAEKIAKKYNLPCTVFGREKALELGMGGFCAVDVGSDQDGKFIIMEYKTKEEKAPTIVLVGKGVVFDTGGINLKPTSGIESMKYDMSGAAAVIAMLGACAQIQPSINVIGIAPCVENMPSGKATRPDDIITCMNGKTVEIKNTDAEGRLILADALCYAEKYYNPDIIFDIATLTGAVSYALGHFYTGLLTKDEQLISILGQLGKKTGDRIWPLPMDDDFKEAIKSDIADIHNNGHPGYLAGTIIGGIFLQNFVSKARWAHLDIAGTAYHVTGVNYLGKGATGAAIRLLMEFIGKYNTHTAQK